MEYLVVIIVSIVLISILFFSLRSTVKRIDINTKKFFIDKLQDYDYLIDDKQKILDELNEEIIKKKEILENEFKDKNKTVNVKDESVYYGVTSIPKYMDEELFQKYKNIRDKFSFDKNEIILDFINNNVQKDTNDYEILFNIRKKFTSNIIYEIIRLQPKQQKEYISEMLSELENKILKKHLKIENIRINAFIIELDTILEKNDPIVYVYTGEKNKNYDHISPIIKTKYDKTINEGLKINYKGNLYDYSL